MSLENPFSRQESKKLNYENLLSSIVKNNGRLSDIAQKLLERKDLLAITPATLDNSLGAYGVNSIGDNLQEGIEIKGVRINPENMTEEVAIHELIHFFSMPALKGGFDAEQQNKLQEISENVKDYWLKTKALWSYAKQNNYEAINSHSKTQRGFQKGCHDPFRFRLGLALRQK